jgi:phage baseplate assembly protein V
MTWAAGDMDRRMQGVVRIGVVSAVDAGAARAKVRLGGDTESAWLPWLAERAATVSVWAPVSIGEQVLVLSPGGDTAQGVICGSLFSDARPAPSANGAEHRLQLGDASIAVVDGAITITAGGTVVRISGAGVSVNATVAVTGGDVSVSGGDVDADGISLKGHAHTITGGSSAGTTTSPDAPV